MKVRKDIPNLTNGMCKKQKCEKSHISGTIENEEINPEFRD